MIEVGVSKNMYQLIIVYVYNILIFKNEMLKSDLMQMKCGCGN